MRHRWLNVLSVVSAAQYYNIPITELFCFVLDYEEEHKYVEWYRNRSVQDTGRLCKAKHRKAFLTGYQGVGTFLQCLSSY
ncbi:hypothetical protein QQG55_40595 [Brugia pahangi]